MYAFYCRCCGIEVNQFATAGMCYECITDGCLRKEISKEARS